MNQYTVLLVDDEEEAVQVIMKKLDWESMGFKIVGYARNGVEALEMAEELQPDVVMTDIKMPYMDGLTLCKKLKELYQKVKVIIFSGFDEFEYAKEAIKIEAEEYILKPINSNELREVFERIKTNLDKEMDEKRNIDKLRAYYMESLPVLQENFYTSLIEGRIPEEQLTEKWGCKAVTYLGDILLITQLPDVDDITHFTDDMDRFCRMAKRVCKACVTAGIGHICNQLGQLSLSYQGAKNATSYRVLYGNTRAINIAEMDPHENVDEHWEEAYIQKILKKVKMGEREPLEEAIAEFAAQMAKTKMSLQNYRILVMELIAEIFRFGSNHEINMEEVFGENSDVYNQALQLESTEDLGAWLTENCIRMQRQITSERQDTTKSFVTRAIEYVKENYAKQDLSIETICSYLNVSAAYFSTVFKKETGKTFINYLTDYRMEQAVELLLTRDEKTYVIAEKVGYSDPNYFSYVFKKQFGMSPSKYKAGKLSET